MELLLAYDGSDCANTALEEIGRAGLPGEGSLMVLCAGLAARSSSVRDAATQKIRSYIPGWKIFSEVPIGLPEDVVLTAARLWQPDLLMLGSSLKSENALAGTVAMHVVHQVPCSVRIVPDRMHRPNGPTRVLVGYDGSRSAQAVIGAIIKRSWPANTELMILSVFDGELQLDARAKIREHANQFANKFRNNGINTQANTINGDPRRDIIHEAHRWNADAIFLGARGLSDIDRFLLGSVSTAVVTRAQCPVEIVR